MINRTKNARRLMTTPNFSKTLIFPKKTEQPGVFWSILASARMKDFVSTNWFKRLSTSSINLLASKWLLE